GLALIDREIGPEAYRPRARLVRAAVGGLHEPRAAPGDHREAGLAEQPREVAGQLVLRRPPRGAGGAEHGHTRPDMRQRVEAVLDLLPDALDARLVVEGREDLGNLGLEQLLVERLRCARLLGGHVRFEPSPRARLRRGAPRAPRCRW